MHTRLTHDEINSFTLQATTIYQKYNFSPNLLEKLIQRDLTAINIMREWCDVLEQSLSLDKYSEATHHYISRAKCMTSELKELGCSDEQVQQLFSMSCQNDFKKIDILKNTIDRYQNISNKIINSINEQNLEDSLSTFSRIFKDYNDNIMSDEGLKQRIGIKSGDESKLQEAQEIFEGVQELKDHQCTIRKIGFFERERSEMNHLATSIEASIDSIMKPKPGHH